MATPQVRRKHQEDEATRTARTLMHAFAERTGVIGDAPPRRYLWTDAFAVCNFLALGEADLADKLVEQVHAVLGRHRDDDDRRGWIGGLDEETATVHPTRGGLRIGKPLPERTPDAFADTDLEWDRDGQYFHYLTKWMHALDQLARRTANADAGRWARELAQSAHRAFTYSPIPGGPQRMYWKMRIDLSAPLVTSMGQHDPLDGLITYLQLRTHRPTQRVGHGPELDGELREMATIVAGTNLLTDDPLGIGGLLADAYRLAQLLRVRPGDNPLLGLVVGAAANEGRSRRKTPDITTSQASPCSTPLAPRCREPGSPSHHATSPSNGLSPGRTRSNCARRYASVSNPPIPSGSSVSRFVPATMVAISRNSPSSSGPWPTRCVGRCVRSCR